MAKSEKPGLVEQYIEKGVLGICALFLIIALFVWGVSSPRSIKLGGQDAELNNAGPTIHTEAAKRLKAIEDLPPPDFLDLDYRKQVEGILDGPLSKRPPKSWAEVGLADVQPVLPDQPRLKPWPQLPPLTKSIIPPKLTVESLTRGIPQLGRPSVRIEQELLYRPPQLPEETVARGAVVFSVGKLHENWDMILTRRIPFVFAVAAVEVERQERLPDGTWGSGGKTGQIQKVRTIVIDKEGMPRPAPDYLEMVPEFDGTDQSRNAVRAAFKKLENEQMLKNILEPEYGNIFWPTWRFGTWLIHLPDNEVTDDARRAGAKATAPPGYETRETIAPTPRPSTTTPLRRDRRFPIEEYDEEDVLPPGRLPPPRSTVSPAEIRRPVTPAKREGVQEPEVLPVPAMRAQVANGKVLVWFHDISPKPRKEYRYRVRLVLANPLLSYVDEAGAADASQRFVASAWSAWSDGVPVPETTEIFVTGQWREKKKVTVSVATQSLGQVLWARFSLEQGQAIGGIAQVEFIHPHTGAKGKQALNFDTGAVIVSLDFNKPVTATRKTIEMLYMDDKGQLKRTITVHDMDRESETYKRFDDLDKGRVKGPR